MEIQIEPPKLGLKLWPTNALVNAMRDLEEKGILTRSNLFKAIYLNGKVVIRYE